MAALHEAVEGFGGFGGEVFVEGGAEEGTLAAGVEHLGEGSVVEDDAAVRGERDDAGGDGFDDGLEFGAAALEGGVEGGALAAERECSRSAAMVLKLSTSSPSSSVADWATRWR